MLRQETGPPRPRKSEPLWEPVPLRPRERGVDHGEEEIDGREEENERRQKNEEMEDAAKDAAEERMHAGILVRAGHDFRAAEQRQLPTSL